MIVLAATMLAASYAPAPCDHTCVERVKHRITRAREREEWRSYKREPMPWCTWALESGPPSAGNPEWRGRRYRVKNPSSTASGKYQILTSTWVAYGGGSYASQARYARRLHQERVARRIAYWGTVVHRPQGLGAWVGC